MPLQNLDRKILSEALSDLPPFATVRGRQTIIRNAVDGFPLSAEINKTLRWVIWEGSSSDAAGDLLTKLDGHQLAPGLSALAVIAQAIEPMAGSAHRHKLADLRNRMGWGNAEPASPAETWNDKRPTAEVAEEIIIGENTLKPMYYLRRALATAEAVVRIDLRPGDATGFLVAPNLMMTNHHAISTQEQARRCRVIFFDEAADQGQVTRKQEIALPSNDPLLYTNKDLDVSLIRLTGAPAVSCIPLRPVTLEKNRRVAIIQHPGGYPKQISLQNNLVAFADDTSVQYYTSTKPGSSGSPVLDDEFAAVALHRGSVITDAGSDNTQVRVFGPQDVVNLHHRNQGTSMIAILKDLEKSAPELLAELTILR